MQNTNSEIDFVVTWVDGGDKEWRNEKQKYTLSGNNDDREERYRDWDILRYWFRGVEKYAPWVRKIHFVTWGHLPKWLETDNPKLHIVNHKDYMPKDILPVFNCNPIEIFMHKIEGLSENFVYFNDDIFLLKEVKETDFFRDGKPCDMLAFQPVVSNPANPVMSYLYLNNSVVLSKHFNKRENVRRQPRKYFHIGYPPLYFFYNMLELAFPLYTGFYTVHGPMPFCKKTFEELWEIEREVLLETGTHRFRNDRDVTLYLFREWQKLSGNFVAKNVQRKFKYFELDNSNKRLKEVIRRQKAKIICINDANEYIEYERVKNELAEVFDSILPKKSSFEK